MNKSEIAEKLFSIVKEQLELSKDAKLTLDTNLEDSLGLESLDGIELIIKIEDVFDIEVDEDELPKCKTIGDFVSLVSKYT